MIIDVNKPLTNPKLSELFKKRDAIDPNDRDAIIACMNEIVEETVTNARFLSVVHIDQENIKPDENGNVTFDRGTKINFVQLNGPENKPYFPVFTDWEQLRKWEDYKDGDVNTMILSFDDYFTMTRDQGSGIVINPFGNNILFTNEDMLRFNRIKELNQRGHAEHVITEETKAVIGDPAVYPTEMMEAMKTHAKKQKNINAMWLKLMENKGEKSFLITVDFTGDRAKTFDGIAAAAKPHIPQGMFIDMISAEEKIAESIVGDEPFYKKKKGLFGLFG